MTCQNCHFWGKVDVLYMGENGDSLHRNDYSDEDLAEDGYFPTGHRKCFRIIHGNGSRPVRGGSGELAMVYDGSGYAATLYTKADFGCALFEEKK